MEHALTIDHEAEIFAPPDSVLACLVDPATLARCVPGAILTDTEGTSVRGRIRLKRTAVPVQYGVDGRLTRPDLSTGVVALEGSAEDRRTGHATEFRMRVSVTNAGSGQARCRIVGELDGGVGEAAEGPSPQAVADRLLPQFTRRLEELAGEWLMSEGARVSGAADEGALQNVRRETPMWLSRQVARGTARVSEGVAVGRRLMRHVRSAAARPSRVADRISGLRSEHQGGVAMELENTFTVPVSINEAWKLLLDPERVATCIPGATLESVDGDDMKGRVHIKLGPMAMLYRGTARFVERDNSAHTVVVEATGKESSGAGGVKAQARMSLTEVAEGTKCTVITDLAITGKAAQFGRGVLADVSQKLVDQFAARLAHEVDNGGTTPEAGRSGAISPRATNDDAIDLLGAVGWRRVALAAAPIVAVTALGWVVLRRTRRKRT